MLLSPEQHTYFRDIFKKFDTEYGGLPENAASGRFTPRKSATEPSRTDISSRAYLDVYPHEALHALLSDTLNYGTARERAFTERALRELGIEVLTDGNGRKSLAEGSEEALAKQVGEESIRVLAGKQKPAPVREAFSDFVDYLINDKLTPTVARRILRDRTVFGAGTRGIVARAARRGGMRAAAGAPPVMPEAVEQQPAAQAAVEKPFEPVELPERLAPTRDLTPEQIAQVEAAREAARTPPPAAQAEAAQAQRRADELAARAEQMKTLLDEQEARLRRLESAERTRQRIGALPESPLGSQRRIAREEARTARLTEFEQARPSLREEEGAGLLTQEERDYVDAQRYADTSGEIPMSPEAIGEDFLPPTLRALPADDARVWEARQRAFENAQDEIANPPAPRPPGSVRRGAERAARRAERESTTAMQSAREAAARGERIGPDTDVTRPEAVEYTGAPVPANVRAGVRRREAMLETPADLEARRIEEQLSGRDRGRDRYQPLLDEEARARNLEALRQADMRRLVIEDVDWDNLKGKNSVSIDDIFGGTAAHSRMHVEKLKLITSSDPEILSVEPRAGLLMRDNAFGRAITLGDKNEGTILIDKSLWNNAVGGDIPSRELFLRVLKHEMGHIDDGRDIADRTPDERERIANEFEARYQPLAEDRGSFEVETYQPPLWQKLQYQDALKSNNTKWIRQIEDDVTSKAILHALQPDFGGIPESERITSQFVRGDSLPYEELQDLQSDYEKWAKKAGIEPTSLVHHVGSGNAVVWSPYGTKDRLVGQFIGDVFAVSHFAPKSQKSAVDSLLDLLHTQTPTVFAVPETLAKQLNKLGFRESSLIVPMHFRNTVQQKHLLVNKAVTGDDIKKLAAWWVATAKLNGLFDQGKLEYVEQAASEGAKLLPGTDSVNFNLTQADRKIIEGERYQPLGPERGEYKGAKLPERERRVFGRGIFAGNVEALRRTGDPQKVEFAGAMEELYARIRNYTGQYEEGIIRPLTDLSKDSQQKVVEALYDESMAGKPATAGLSPDELAAHREIRAGLAKMRNDQIAANHLIEGKPAGRDPFYFPHVVDSSIIHDLSNSPESPRAKEAERQFIDFNAELFRNKGVAPAVAMQRATEAFGKFIGSLKPISVDSGFDYGAVSMPAGTKLPPTWVAADPVDGFRSYIKRFSRARAFYDVIGRDENSMRQIGRKFYYDAAGKEAAVANPGSRLQRDPNVRALLENALGITHESQEGITPAIGRLANSLLLGNVATRLTDAATTPFKALAYLPPRYIPGLLTNMRNLRSSIDNAYKTGGVRRGDMMVVREILGAGDRYVKGMDKVAETITKYTGSEALEKGARFLAQNVGEYIYDVNKMLADSGDKRAADFLNRVTPKWRTLAREETAQRIARLFQGNYDATNLPIWIANSPAAPFFSMMKWNIEQWNNFKRFAWEPALKGDPYALMATVLGGVAGGIAVGELREKITGKKQRVATAGELNFGFREGDKARASMEAMRKAAFLSQVTGTFGIVGELSLQAIDVASKDKPQGFSWPAYEFVSNVIGKIANAVPAAIERPEDALLVAGTAANDLAKDIVAQYRILWNAVDRTKGAGEVEEANRRRDLRMSEKLRGEPTRFSPFIERDYRNERERQFDKARDRQQAVAIAKQLDQRARRESATGEEYKEARRKFRSSRIVGIPSAENNPQQFYRHIQFVRNTQGAEAADQLARDYVMLRTEQKWKSSMFR